MIFAFKLNLLLNYMASELYASELYVLLNYMCF